MNLIERQRGLLAEHPDEWCVLVGDYLFSHTTDEEVVWREFARAWEEVEAKGGPEPIVVPPVPERDTLPPPLRGQSLPV